MAIAAKKTSQVVMHMGVAFAVMYALTGSAAFGGLAAIVEPICNVLLLPLHDRVWERMARSLSDARVPALQARPQVARAYVRN